MFASKFLPIQSSECIKILVTSDIHLSLSNIHKLNAVLSTLPPNERPDFVLCCGDLCNMDIDDQVIPEKVACSEGEMSALICALENIQAKVLYVPGNHDPISTFSKDAQTQPRLTTHSINIHNKTIRLLNDLVICGFGGSVAGYKDGEQVWRGYPFNEDEMREYLNNLLEVKRIEVSDRQKVDEILEGDTVILVSHVGPHSSSTTVDQRDVSVSPITSGCKSLDLVLRNPSHQKSILCNIHGHTHHALGMSRVGKTYVINPGSLRTGHYSIVELRRIPLGKWQIHRAEFNRI